MTITLGKKLLKYNELWMILEFLIKEFQLGKILFVLAAVKFLEKTVLLEYIALLNVRILSGN